METKYSFERHAGRKIKIEATRTFETADLIYDLAPDEDGRWYLICEMLDPPTWIMSWPSLERHSRMASAMRSVRSSVIWPHVFYLTTRMLPSVMGGPGGWFEVMTSQSSVSAGKPSSTRFGPPVGLGPDRRSKLALNLLEAAKVQQAVFVVQDIPDRPSAGTRRLGCLRERPPSSPCLLAQRFKRHDRRPLRPRLHQARIAAGGEGSSGSRPAVQARACCRAHRRAGWVPLSKTKGPSHFSCRITEPSDTFGGAAPVSAAFLATHSLATRTLSSAPALS